MLEKLAASQGHAQAEEDEELLVAALLQKPGHPLAEEREEEDEGGPGAHPLAPVEGEEAHGHQVLEDQDPEGDPPVVGGELLLVLQDLGHQDRAGEAEGDGQGKVFRVEEGEGGEEAEVEAPREEDPGVQEVLQAELQPHAEEEEEDPDLGDLVEEGRPPDAGSREKEPGNQVAHEGGRARRLARRPKAKAAVTQSASTLSGYQTPFPASLRRYSALAKASSRSRFHSS